MYDTWEFDDQHNALNAWLTMWRRQNPDAPLPAWTFAAHLGADAREAKAAGTSRVDLARVFSRAGWEGRCPCGHTPDDVVLEQASQIVDDHRGRALTWATQGGIVKS